MKIVRYVSLLFLVALFFNQPGKAQQFDFDKLNSKAAEYTVVLDMQVEISLGTQSSQQEQRLIGSLVSDDGLIIFDGSSLDFEHPLSVLAGSMFKATPTRIKVTTLDEQEFSAEFIGVDRFTKIGFVRLVDASPINLKPLRFAANPEFRMGQFVGILSLLPKHVEPKLGAGLGMIAAVLNTPELFPVATGFRPIQAASVLYNENLEPLGVLGFLNEFSDGTGAPPNPFDDFDESAAPIMGIIVGNRVNDLIANPPQAGNSTRAWLGITLQAMTPDIAEFLGIDAVGGIIVNNVVKGSPALKAGLVIGDIVYKVNGQAVEVDNEDEVPIFQRVIAEMEPGTAVELAVFRPTESGLENMSLIANLEAAPMTARDAAEYENVQLELKVRDLVFGDFLMFNMDEETLFGVLVSELESGSRSFIGGLYIGDVIQQVDGQEVRSVEEFQRLMEARELSRPSEVIFLIFRDNKTLFVNVKTGW